MSYTLTLDVPHSAVEFAERQAARHNVDMSILFVTFLRDRFGYQYEGAVDRMEDGEISPLTRSLSGIARVDDDIDGRDLTAKAMLDKYEALP